MSRENKELLVEMGYEDAVILENPDYDSAIIGVSESGRVIYDYDKMVEWLMETFSYLFSLVTECNLEFRKFE